MVKKLLIFGMIFFLLISCYSNNQKNEKKKSISFEGKKVYYIDSYHESYKPNIKTRDAFKEGIANKNIETAFSYLDAKNISDSEILNSMAKKIYKKILDFNPDVIVISDDAAMKYVAEPYLKDSNIPIVFIGINWRYDKPSKNMTGQLEVEIIEKLIQDLKKYSKGSRIGILTAETVTDIKNVKAYKEILGIKFEEEVFVKNFLDWKKAYINLQSKVDILIVRQNSGIANWNENLAKECIIENTSIPTGSTNFHMNQYVLLCYPKMNEEYGMFAADKTLMILSGNKAADIPIEKNRQSNYTANMTLAKKLGILFPSDFMDVAHLVLLENKKIAFVNSYHKGYEWSDAIEKGLLNALSITDSIKSDRYLKDGIELRCFYMDAKNNPEDSIQKKYANKIYSTIETWNPNLIIASDDAASKWLIVPYYKNTKTPVLYCGVNWDAAVYGYDVSNVRGMVEVAPINDLVAYLKKYSEGNKIGYLGADILSEKKEVEYYKSVLSIPFSNGALVKNKELWKKMFVKLQKDCDILILLSYMGIKDWDKQEMKEFVLKNTKIPTGTSTRFMRYYALITFARIPEEQGTWVGNQALSLLNGQSINSIVSTRNKEHVKFVNEKIMSSLGIKLPASQLDTIFFVNEGDI